MNFLTPPEDRNGTTSDGSADDIMASIRRILSREDTPGPVGPSLSQAPTPAVKPAPKDNALTSNIGSKMKDGPDRSSDLAIPVMPPPPDQAASGMIAPEAARSAAAAISQLMRSVAQNHSVGASRNGPTIEDLVREEMRPMLQEWLNRHLSPMVERLVRAELERLSAGAHI